MTVKTTTTEDVIVTALLEALASRKCGPRGNYILEAETKNGLTIIDGRFHLRKVARRIAFALKKDGGETD